MPVVVGTSGWQYRDWRGLLYPPDLPQRDWLAYYASQYATVENNSTFYRLPARDTFADWQARTPGDFVMAIKASRYLTHVKRLRDPEEPVAKLMAAAAGLGGRLGPVLLQLPPNLTADPGRLAACLEAFARCPGAGTRVRVAVEPRHPSWWTEEVRQVLAAHASALCWADQLGRPVTPLWQTAGWGYLRFHQGAAHPWPRYGLRALHSWVDRVCSTWPDDATVYVYFNNDPGGAAVADSAAFAAACRRAGHAVTRVAGNGAPAG
ncbi:MAG TPA: DUF72 domain-containing protein [Streptosporangiaceae bacterium]|jgi:uncharacterized protein YecE (DUF72 family)|nr:DUF72 domain-containing protein [Streptosporangiaceae bacterium]